MVWAQLAPSHIVTSLDKTLYGNYSLLSGFKFNKDKIKNIHKTRKMAHFQARADCPKHNGSFAL